jgi:uncharacterized cofD-like protein
MEKIVTIGGGTGHFQLLRGLKNYELELCAISNMSDDGGSSGRLRDEYGFLPPGDVRQCLVALSPEQESQTFRALFNYRFNDGHNLGNLIIAALGEHFGNIATGIKAAGEILGIEGEVLPVTTDNCILKAKTLEGRMLNGQTEVSYPKNVSTQISKLFYDPMAYLYKEAGSNIRDADKIVICPGDLYGSILPNLIVEGMAEAMKDSNAMKIYVCNIFTKHGNVEFKASDFVREIERYSRIKMDNIILNTKQPSEEVVNKYFSEYSKLVEDDLAGDDRVVRGEFAAEYLSEPKTILRHVPEKIARAIIGL